MIEGLATEARLILRAHLSPIVGSAFQPTGFPDLGAAEFKRPSSNGGTQDALLIESVQSLANHLEARTWNADENRPVDELARLPYLEVRDSDDRFLTSSRTEPHRLAGAYIKNSVIDGVPAGDWMIERLGVDEDAPIDWASVYRAVFELDPLCLIHGVFFSDPKWSKYGNPKVRRAVTPVLEARGVKPVISGGVKRDDVMPKAGEHRGGSKEGYGFVPFGRTEYTADDIVMEVAVDLEQIRGYGLDEAKSQLLTAVALWELRALLDKPLRLRTACDLKVEAVDTSAAEELPTTEELAATIADSPVEFEHPGARTARWE